MAEKLVQTGEDVNGVYNVMTGLDFARALNKNAEELGTATKLDLEIHNTPEAIRNALREQAGKIGWHTPGGPDDLPTYEEEGAPVDSPSELKDGLAQIYNKALDGDIPDPEPEPEPEPTKELTGITVKTSPTKTEYKVGDSLDLAGMVVVKNYSDGTEEEFSEYTTEITPSGMDVAGEKTVKVKYPGFEDSFAITVAEAPAPIKEEFNVNFIVNGAVVSTSTVEEGSSVSRPADPVVEGFTFEGWFEDDTFTNAFDFSKAIEADTDVYAKMVEIPAEAADLMIGFIPYTEGSTIANFAAKTLEQLQAGVLSEHAASESPVTTTTTQGDGERNHIFYVMIKDGLNPTSARMVSGGIPSDWTGAEVMDPTEWAAVHDDVEIDGTTYHIYGYRTKFNDDDTMTISVA